MSRSKKIETARRWTFDDHVAFECALAKDEQVDWTSLRERDKTLAAQAGLWELPSRRAIAKRWLAERLKQTPSIEQAAESICQSVAVAGRLLALLGCALGVGLAAAALAYTGEEPINVSAFFLVFVLLQALLACLLILPFLLPRSWKERMARGPLFRFAYFLFHFAFEKSQALASRFLAGSQRQDAAEIAAQARRQLALRKDALAWLAFSKIQAAALCFNLGALFALLVAVAFSDRAFGWQTTLDARPEAIQSIVRFFASPWSLLYGEGVGYPNLEQIESSRIRLVDSPGFLDADSLSAWWQFLALGILFYGIAPRLLLYFLGLFQMRKALQSYDYRNAAAEQLFGRLAPPTPRFQVQEVEQASKDAHSPSAMPAQTPASSTQKVACYYSKELAEVYDIEALRESLASRWNLPKENLSMHASANGAFPNAAESAANDCQFALVYESWMPPIKETERQIKALRSEAHSRSLIKIVLLGIPDPGGDGISIGSETKYANIWNAFARRQGDPYLMIDNPA